MSLESDIITDLNRNHPGETIGLSCGVLTTEDGTVTTIVAYAPLGLRSDSFSVTIVTKHGQYVDVRGAAFQVLTGNIWAAFKWVVPKGLRMHMDDIALLSIKPGLPTDTSTQAEETGHPGHVNRKTFRFKM